MNTPDIKGGVAATKKRAKGFSKEFQKFISRGNVVDLAVGVIIGAAFGKIVTSLVNDIIMPILGTALGGINFKELTFTIWGNATIAYGNFLQNIIDFVIVAFSIFIFIKLFNKLIPTKKPEVCPPKPIEKAEDAQVRLLREIRDSLKQNGPKK